MIHTIQQLKHYNPNLKKNNFQLTIHALVLILNLVPILFESLPVAWFTPRLWAIIDIFLIVTDTIS